MKEMIRKSAKGFVALVLCLGFVSYTGAQEVTLNELYFKSGNVSRCEQVWKGLGDFVWCDRGGNVRGYPANDIDHEKTFEIPLRAAHLIDQSLNEFSEKNWDGAIQAATAAISLDPDNEVAYANRAGAYSEKGLLREAINDCNKALNINPHYALAYNNRGYAMERAGKLSQAAADYELSCRMGNELACKNLARLKPPEK